MPLRVVALIAALAGALLLGAGAGAARPDEQTPLARRLARALAAPQLDTTRSAAVAVDLLTGTAVFTRHHGLALVPASNEKLAVTYATLVALGPGFRIRTDVLGAGARRGSTLAGTLVLKGYGDPTLTLGDLRTLAKQVRRAGITRVTGGVAGDESFFDDRRTGPGWKAYFFRNESPPLSALSVDRGRYGGVTSVRPAVGAAAVLKGELRRAGVAVSGPAFAARAPRNAIPLGSVVSAPLWRILRFMDRESDNFTAELLLKQLGALLGGRGSTAAGAAVATRVLTADGIPMAGVRIADGSGLSRLNRLTAAALIGILQAAWTSPQLRPAFVGALPVAGRSGTLRHRLLTTATRGRVFAKTGTTSLSSSLAGFVRDRYAFAIVHNGSPVASWWARQAQDRFVAALASAK